MAEQVRFLCDALLLSYSRIFFAEDRTLGALVLLATLTAPQHAVFGLIGGGLSSLTAWVVGVDRDSVRKGVYGLNGILTGLGIGYYFAPTPAMLIVLLVTSVFLTFVTVFLNALLYRHCGLPAMSMPFTLVSWLVMGASTGCSRMVLQGARAHLAALPSGLLPSWLESFCSALGAVLFRLDPLTGLVIVVGLLAWSRMALLLLAVGFVTTAALQAALGIDPRAVGGDALTFNQMFTALAVGGIFTVPGPGSLLMAILAASGSLLSLAGTMALLPAAMSPLALPFNLGVWVTLYTLNLRLHPSLDLFLAPAPPGSPEENLNRSREQLRAWKRWGVALSLPFRGSWTVSQGIDGGITHRGDWRFAYDFHVLGPAGASFSGTGSTVEEYYAYGLPVIAPAPGTVHTVIDGIADNAVGRTNASDNWGNCVILEHAPNYYSCLAHLKPGSILVKPGDFVGRGSPLGQCGNSGRSPWPHLHFQAQMSPLVGAPAIAFELANILVARSGREEFAAKGGLREGDAARNAEPCSDYGQYFPYLLGTGWPFRLYDGSHTHAEMWEAGIDFYGNNYLASYPKKTRLFFVLQDGVLSVKKIEGCRDSGLFLFGSLIAELPFIETYEGVAWRSVEAADYVLWPAAVTLCDVFSLVGLTLRQEIEAQLVRTPDGLRVTTASRIILETPFGPLPLRRRPDGELLLRRDDGVVLARAGKRELRQVRAEDVQPPSPPMPAHAAGRAADFPCGNRPAVGERSRSMCRCVPERDMIRTFNHVRLVRNAA
jgi:urea transporter/murein DD-endopeptidase MepM/ murein hydrolase activator NlpD